MSDWRADAACLGDWRVFDAAMDRPGTHHLATQEALRVCRTLCPVREQCLAFAVAERLPGVWGGTTDRQRTAHGVGSRVRTSRVTAP